MVIRPATHDDMDALLKVAQTFIEESSWGYTYSEPASREVYSSYLDDPFGAIVVAEDDGEILGAWLAFVSYEFVNEPACYVGKFYVTPEGRGTGVGRSLMESLAKWADKAECKHAFLTATAMIGEDKQFINLCRKFGFVPCGLAMVRR